MRIRLHYRLGSTMDYDIKGMALDEDSMSLDLIVIVNPTTTRLEHINWPAVTSIENLEAMRL